MTRFSYSLLLYFLSPLIWCYLLFRAIKSSSYREGFLQRLGLIPRSARSSGIIVHCASVGETKAAEPLIRKLLEHYPDLPIQVTTTTPTGKASLLASFADRVEHFYLPIDWLGACHRFISRLQPKIVILMETELWPNLLHVCQSNNVPVLLANARLSKKSLTKYRNYPKLSAEIFHNINQISAQYQSDKQNFLALGVAPQKIECVGSIKFDIKISDTIKSQQQQLKSLWLKDAKQQRPVWIAASIHPAEFSEILTTQQQLLKTFPDLLLIAVPRHPEKFTELKVQCEKHHLSFVSRSEKQTPVQETQVMVVDTMGEMTLFCGLADIAYVGGSLIERGGHNPLEAIACGTPVIMGPHYYNFRDVCQILIEHKVLQIVHSADELGSAIENRLSNSDELLAQSADAISIIQQNSGSVEKMLHQISALIEARSN